MFQDCKAARLMVENRGTTANYHFPAFEMNYYIINNELTTYLLIYVL